MDTFIAEVSPQQFQQPPTTSGLKAPLDWAVFISLLLLIALGFYRQVLKSGNADQKVLETLINDLRASNQANSKQLTEIATALSQKQSEDQSVVFRLRDATNQLSSISQSTAATQSALAMVEREISALHRRLDLVGAPHSSDRKEES